MPALDAQRWRRASPHLDRVLDLAPADREACLAALRLQDPEVAADVQTLLDQHRDLHTERFLEQAAGVVPGLSPLAGLTVGAYTLEEPIGHGGMGSVWRASRSDGRFEGSAAVKLLNAELVGRTGGERFKREGTILARLTHPHIARLIDAGVSMTGQPYLVLEYIDGRNIDKYCDGEGLDVEARIRLFLDVLSAVAHAHANLIVHRDLKPSNVLVTHDGQVKLLDFGIAKLLEDDTRPREVTLTREVGAGMTPKYAAPEQVTRGPITTATDVYALGVLLYGLLTGQHPAGPEPLSAAAIVKAIVEIEPRRVSAVAKDPRAAAQPSRRSRHHRREGAEEDSRRALRLGRRVRRRPAPLRESPADRRAARHVPAIARPSFFAAIAAAWRRRPPPW